MATVLIITLYGSFGANAESSHVPDVRKKAEQGLREGLEDVLRALKLMLRVVPQYQMPQVLDNGDIIIRRQQPELPRYPNAIPSHAKGYTIRQAELYRLIVVSNA